MNLRGDGRERRWVLYEYDEIHIIYRKKKGSLFEVVNGIDPRGHLYLKSFKILPNIVGMVSENGSFTLA